MRIVSSALVFIMLVAALLGCHKDRQGSDQAFESRPVLLGAHSLITSAVSLAPVRLQLRGDTLFVSYRDAPYIDLLTTDLDRIATISLTRPQPITPTAFFVTDSHLVVANHAGNVVVLYTMDGTVVTSFGTLPDGVTPLSPFSLTCFGGVAYIGDARQRGVLAVSLVDAEGITEQGELILRIPSDSLQRIDFPSAVMVTPDGRLLAGDAGQGTVKVFTCDGRFVYSFDGPELPVQMAPQGFDIDDVTDPSLQDSASFDPSGIRLMGRIHVVDAGNRRVHMFNPLGTYIASYPEGTLLMKPSGIAIDRARKKIYIADPAAQRIFVFGY